VLQLRIIEDDSQPELQRIYQQLVKDSTELFVAIAQKMSRLRTKMDFSSCVTRRVRPPPQGQESGAQTARPRRQTDAWDQTSSHRSHNYRELSARCSGTYTRFEDNNQPSGTASAPLQGRCLGRFVHRNPAPRASRVQHGIFEAQTVDDSLLVESNTDDLPTSIASSPWRGLCLGDVVHRNTALTERRSLPLPCAASTGRQAALEAQTVGNLSVESNTDDLPSSIASVPRRGRGWGQGGVVHRSTALTERHSLPLPYAASSGGQAEFEPQTVGNFTLEGNNDDLLNLIDGSSTFQDLPQLDPESANPSLK